MWQRHHTLFDAAAALFLIAGIYVLVRPQSKGADLVKGLGNALTAITTQATDIAA